MGHDGFDGMDFGTFEEIQEVMQGMMEWEAIQQEGNREKAIEFLRTCSPRVRYAIAFVRHQLFVQGGQAVAPAVGLYLLIGMPQELADNVVNSLNAAHTWIDEKLEELQALKDEKPKRIEPSVSLSQEEDARAHSILGKVFGLGGEWC